MTTTSPTTDVMYVEPLFTDAERAALPVSWPATAA
jgi:hypothetical protein